MTRHGISHGAATLVTAVTASLISGELRAALPTLARGMDDVSRTMLRLLELEGSFTPQGMTSLLLASALAVIWGVVFGFLHREAS